MNPIEKLGDLLERVVGYPFSRVRCAVKGQTALEYLLIIVVAIIVVVAVWMWVNSTQKGMANTANSTLNRLVYPT
jgi:ABC-type maltose transport system permease subunit